MAEISRRNLLFTSAAAGASALTGGLSIPSVHAQALPTRVDLRGNQTPIRDQGDRGSCIVFAGIAALEAAVFRTYGQRLDLSEEFANFVGKSMWLEPVYDSVLGRGRDGSESQLGWASGGSGVWVLEWLAKGFRVPLEIDMPYVENEQVYRNRWAQITTAPFPTFPQNKQRRINDFNTKTAFLSRDLLYLGRRRNWWWAATGFTRMTDRSVEAIQQVLIQGYEVVCDFANIAHMANDFGIWEPAPFGGGSHSMLIVGYDFTHEDSNRHYFIVKNSWGGATGFPDGFTRVSPSFIAERTTGAGYARAAQRTNWPLLPILGRWKLNDLQERIGTLDIYHIPPLAKPIWEQWSEPRFTGADRRLGTYYAANGDAFKVNGVALAVPVGNRWVTMLDFYIPVDPNLPYDRIGGNARRYRLTLGHGESDFMSGYSTQYNQTTRRPAWAIHEDLARTYSPRGLAITRLPFQAVQWLRTRWKVDITPGATRTGFDLVFDRITGDTPTHLNFAATLIEGSRRASIRVSIVKSNPTRLLTGIPAGWPQIAGTRQAGRLDVDFHPREGVATGTLTLDNAAGGVIMRRY